MPLRITDPVLQVGTLNKWADYIETQLKATNTKIFRVANTAVANTPPSSGGGISDLIYIGDEFTIQNPNGPTTTIVKNNQPAHTFWHAPIPDFTNFLGFTGNNYSSGSGFVATNPTITFTPQQIPSWVYYFESQAGASNTAPTGWTTVVSGAWKQMTSTAPVTATDTAGLSLSWCNVALQFSGVIPAIFNSATVALSFTSSGGIASQTFTTTAGNTLLISVRGTNGNPIGSPASIIITDNQNQTYSAVAINVAGGNPFSGPTQCAVFVAPNIVGGSVTITATAVGVSGGGTSYNADFLEIGPLGAGAGQPVFAPIQTGDLPAISGSSIATGLVALKVGGTGANLSATGGASQVLTQPSVGAAIAVRQLDYPDLAGQSVATEYGTNPLVGKGLPSIVFQNSQVLGGNVTINGGFLTAPTTGLYRVSATLVETVGSGGIDAIPECDFIYGDPTSLGGPITLVLTPVTSATAIGTFTSQSVLVNMRSTTPASFVTTGYAGTGTYHIVVMVEAI